MSVYRILGLIVALALTAGAVPTAGVIYASEKKSALEFTVRDIDGKPVNLAKYRGKVVMIVNVASKCGNTPQYASLQKLYEKYGELGFVVLGFPANDFGKQEPGTNAEIREFCTANYHVSFPMFSKIAVKGEHQAPLYRFLTGKETNPKHGGEIEWNFAKFLIDRRGKVVNRFAAKQDPLQPDVEQAILAELKKRQ